MTHDDDEKEEGAEEEEKQEEGKMPMVTKDGKKVPAFAADGKGDGDLGKADGESKEDDDEDDDKDLDEVFTDRNGKLMERLIKNWATK